MAGLVLDASVTLAWALPGEVRAEGARSLVERVADGGAVVPALWRLEVGDGLLAAARRGRVRAARVDAVWRRLARLPIRADGETDAHAWGATAALARRHGLTPYDAACREIALRLGLPLASFDGPLTRAAVSDRVAPAAGVPGCRLAPGDGGGRPRVPGAVRPRAG